MHFGKVLKWTKPLKRYIRKFTSRKLGDKIKKKTRFELIFLKTFYPFPWEFPFSSQHVYTSTAQLLRLRTYFYCCQKMLNLKKSHENIAKVTINNQQEPQHTYKWGLGAKT